MVNGDDEIKEKRMRSDTALSDPANETISSSCAVKMNAE